MVSGLFVSFSIKARTISSGSRPVLSVVKRLSANSEATSVLPSESRPSIIESISLKESLIPPTSSPLPFA